MTIGGNEPTGHQFATWEPPAEICGREAAQMVLDLALGQPARQITFANHYVPGFSVADDDLTA